MAKPIKTEYIVIAAIGLVCLLGGAIIAHNSGSKLAPVEEASDQDAAPAKTPRPRKRPTPRASSTSSTNTETNAAMGDAVETPHALPAGRRPLRRRGTGITARATPLRTPVVAADGTVAAETPTPEPAVTLVVAHTALTLVGTDPNAETIWAQAINDPVMPEDDRQELIEGLSSVGFADAPNFAQADLPLISARLALIERMAPEALDDTNFEAFQQAYQDLAEAFARLNGN